MAEPLATMDALAARLGYTPVGAELEQATQALADASTVVRAYGAPWPTADSAPDIAIAVTLAAAERRVRFPEGYRSEMEGSYQYQRPASSPLGVELTSGEIRMLQAAAGTMGVVSVQIESLGGVI